MKSCCGTFCCPVISPATSKQEQNECLAEKGKKKIRKHRSGIYSMIASTTCLFTRINEGIFFLSPRLIGLPVWQDFYDLFGRIFDRGLRETFWSSFLTFCHHTRWKWEDTFFLYISSISHCFNVLTYLSTANLDSRNYDSVVFEFYISVRSITILRISSNPCVILDMTLSELPRTS